MKNQSVQLLCVIAGLAAALETRGQDVFHVAPVIYTNAEGPGSTPTPIHIQGAPRTFQFIINESQLTGLVNTQITGISYRHSAVSGGGYPLQTTTWAEYSISLGASVAPSSATGTFANNFTAGSTLVRTGSFTAAPFSWPNPGPPGPAPWGPIIDFDTPYFYTGGHLAMLITHPGSDNPNIGDALIDATGSSSPGQGTDYSFFIENVFNGTAGTSNLFMPIVQFSGFSSVPEPSSFAPWAQHSPRPFFSDEADGQFSTTSERRRSR
jgi:hypothetical protein